MHVTRKPQVLARARTDHEGRDGQHPSTGRTSTHTRTHAHTHTLPRMADAYNRRLHKRTRARKPNSTADRVLTVPVYPAADEAIGDGFVYAGQLGKCGDSCLGNCIRASAADTPSVGWMNGLHSGRMGSPPPASTTQTGCWFVWGLVCQPRRTHAQTEAKWENYP
jgi:hypothetical protein